MPQDVVRILLIDDNKHGLVARRTVLEDLGYEVEIAAGGREGLEAFDGSSFDAVVTDYRMPRVSGLDVLREIRSRNPAVPLILLSGYVGRLGLTAASTGADAVVAKGPSEEQDLVGAIAKLIKKKPRSATRRARRTKRSSA